MHFVFNVKLLLLYRVNSYSTQRMRMPHEIYITKKISFDVRLLHFVYNRSVSKLKYKR